MPRVRCPECQGWILNEESHFGPGGTCERKRVEAKARANEEQMKTRGWRRVGGFHVLVQAAPVPMERVGTSTTVAQSGRLVLVKQLWAPAWVMDIAEAPLSPAVRRALIARVAVATDGTDHETELALVMEKIRAAHAARRLSGDHNHFVRLADG